MSEQTLNKLKFNYQITLGTREKSSILDETSLRILKAIEKKGSMNFALIQAYDRIREEIDSVLQRNSNTIQYTQEPKNGKSGF